jgi:2-C-methyl-D-erythritol 4-phosphate cytidylyltransferase/2-C-methyl-D-erythritol 2,4-cyclodiphosphate synthase
MAQHSHKNKVAAIVLAAGRGVRAGGGVPKQFRPLSGKTVVRVSLDAFSNHPGIGMIQPVVHADDRALFDQAAAGLSLLPAVAGGATRQASVCAGLEALAAQTHEVAPKFVLVHDAARPFVSAQLITRAIDAARNSGAAIPALAVSDTIKSVDDAGHVTATLDRAPLRTVQTPQAFAFDALLAAHRKAKTSGRDDFSDDAALAEWAGLDVATFEGEPGNIKLTNPEDFARMEAQNLASLGDIRTGSGIDVHAFVPGDHVMIGGVRIPHSLGVTGHSDADVGLHALVDAILGALADGDIGMHFPPSDPRWRGASSDQFLKFAADRVAARGGIIAHLDLSIVCEGPKIGPHRDAMRARIAEIAGIGIDRVAVKATTSEKLGFTGRSEGIAAYATATVRLPWSAT